MQIHIFMDATKKIVFKLKFVLLTKYLCVSIYQQQSKKEINLFLSYLLLEKIILLLPFNKVHNNTQS